MDTLEKQIINYLTFCISQKRLDSKTIKAYRIDLLQFARKNISLSINAITVNVLENYISELNQTYKPKTVKRKIASIKAFFRYLEYKDILTFNPFNKMRIKLREPVVLPKIIPLSSLEHLLKTVYHAHSIAKSTYHKTKALQDIAVLELLFSTGIRVSELCQIKYSDICFSDRTLLIDGKGSKQRRIQICNDDVLHILMEYEKSNRVNIQKVGYFFTSPSGTHISDQSIRRMINKYSSIAALDLHITPHMFRHTFATSLLESDVDIRFIQSLLGHSSINVTEIYTHVTTAKQRDILSSKHPRKNFAL